MRQSSPFKSEDVNAVAKTNWDMNFSYSLTLTKQGCRIVNFEPNLTISFILPKLHTNNDDVRSVWNAWFPKLLEHEIKHAKFAEDSLNVIKKIPQRLNNKYKCKDLNFVFENTINEELEILRQKNEDFDKKSDHGLKDGTDLRSYYDN